MASEGELWHLVEARRDDGTPAMFRIRDVEPRPEQPRIFVVELPYPVTGLSRLPDAAAYRRLTQFEEQWLSPACAALGWIFVAAKTEDGSFFLYLYGSDEPTPMIEKLSPFDGSLGFYDEQDPNWDEYAALRELLDQANAMPPAQALEPEVTPPALLTPVADETSTTNPVAPPGPRTNGVATSVGPARAVKKAAKPAAARSAARRTARKAATTRSAKAMAKTSKAAANTAVAKKTSKTSAAKKRSANKSSATRSGRQPAPRSAAKAASKSGRPAAKKRATKKR